MSHGDILTEFAEAVLDQDARSLAAARQNLKDALGDAALVDAAAVVAGFNAIDRIADACGIPIEDEKEAATTSLRQELDVESFRADRV